MSEADDVLRSIDQLRRDLSGYHGQLKAHNDLQTHCDNQRKRIGELEVLYAKVKAEAAGLRELVRDMWLQLLNAYDRKEVDEFADRMRELGIQTGDGVS